MNRISKAAALATLAFVSLEAQPLYVSFEEDFNRVGPGGVLGGYISDGDALNWTTGTVFMRNAKLLSAFQRPDTCDLGLDALDVIDDATATTLVAFSTELPSINGTVLPGDVLATNGAIIPNAALFAAFNPPVPRCEYGLDALQFIGKQDDIRRFLTFIAANPVPPAQVPGLMSPVPGGPLVLHRGHLRRTCRRRSPAFPGRRRAHGCGRRHSHSPERPHGGDAVPGNPGAGPGMRRPHRAPQRR